jgi:AcrR family transcriptional regulator
MTRERILRAFLQLATERGIDSTSTKAVAEIAGVSELTVFRHFTDKATLVREAIRYGASTSDLPAQLQADGSSPAAAVESLTRCLKFLRDRALDNPKMFQFVTSEAHRHPELANDLMVVPLRARALLERTLDAVGPQFRVGVQRQTALLTLQGLLLVTFMWTSFGWIRLRPREWDELLEDAARLLIRESNDRPTREPRPSSKSPERRRSPKKRSA